MLLLLPISTTTITTTTTISRGIFVSCQNQRQRQLVVVAAIKNKHKKQDYSTTTSFIHKVAPWWGTTATAVAVAVVVVLLSPVVVMAAIQQSEEDITLSNIPQMLSSGDSNTKLSRIQKPKSRKAESCTIKCVGTCIRGGDGSPGEGPLNIRRPLVVFKQGFRSRQYCLVECSDICNLIKDGDDGP